MRLAYGAITFPGEVVPHLGGKWAGRRRADLGGRGVALRRFRPGIGDCRNGADRHVRRRPLSQGRCPPRRATGRVERAVSAGSPTAVGDRSRVRVDLLGETEATIVVRAKTPQTKKRTPRARGCAGGRCPSLGVEGGQGRYLSVRGGFSERQPPRTEHRYVPRVLERTERNCISWISD
jgi:hypothetical protein